MLRPHLQIRKMIMQNFTNKAKAKPENLAAIRNYMEMRKQGYPENSYMEGLMKQHGLKH